MVIRDGNGKVLTPHYWLRRKGEEWREVASTEYNSNLFDFDGQAEEARTTFGDDKPNNL